MCIESAQLLSSAHPANIAPYKHTHVNHPCAKWVRESRQNYIWLAEHSLALCYEYTNRYNKIHKTQAVAEWLSNNVPPLNNIGLTPFAQAMPDIYKNIDAVEAYKTYYIHEKKDFAKWYPRAIPPTWWPTA